MTSPTRKEIEKLVVALRQGSWRNFEALSAADALCALLADRDRLERERDNLRALAETVCAFVDGDGYAAEAAKAGEAICALRYALAGLPPKDASR